jgi:hypothetical protein
LTRPKRVFQRRRLNTSTCIRNQNDLIIALSKQSAMLPIEGSRPDQYPERRADRL